MSETLVIRVLSNVVFWTLIFLVCRVQYRSYRGLVAGGCFSWFLFIPLVVLGIFVGIYVITFPGQLFLLLTGQLQWNQNIFVTLYQGQEGRNNVPLSAVVDVIFWGVLLLLISGVRSSR